MVPALSFAVLLFASKWDHRMLSIAFSDSHPDWQSEISMKDAPSASPGVSEFFGGAGEWILGLILREKAIGSRLLL